MSSFIYNSYKAYLLSGYAIRLNSDPIYVALMRSSLTPDLNGLSQKVFTQVASNECTGQVGYTGRGKQITSPSITVTTGSNYATFSSSVDLTWGGSTITASGAVVYASGTFGSPAINDPLIAYIDFGNNLTSSLGDFTIQFAAAGIVRISNG